MGGALVVRPGASLPERLGAGASFHGGGLVTDKPDSPHLLAPKIKARMYFGIASNDDERQPDAKDKLKQAFAAAKVSAEIEVYSAQHGWCVPDMPVRDGVPIYNKPEAERAWGKLVALYKATSFRSEEHTSELQSHLNLVCRLLLEKKKCRRGARSLAPPRQDRRKRYQTRTPGHPRS